MKVLRSISAVVLAILVLISSTSLMVGMHLCMGEVQNIAFFSKADGCVEEQSQPACHRHSTAPCCDDETVIHEADDFKASMAHDHIAGPTSMELDQPVVLISEVIPTAPVSRLRYFSYDPPLLSCDRIVDHQVFLI
jgi:hypothetical protein